ncbi:MAG: hypothetical protein JRJ29_19885 [Deltaproteobacteria bacterium]|nr:hypothetical protein [Deltaproteobacteria bacterium]
MIKLRAPWNYADSGETTRSFPLADEREFSDSFYQISEKTSRKNRSKAFLGIVRRQGRPTPYWASDDMVRFIQVLELGNPGAA